MTSAAAMLRRSSPPRGPQPPMNLISAAAEARDPAAGPRPTHARRTGACAPQSTGSADAAGLGANGDRVAACGLTSRGSDSRTSHGRAIALRARWSAGTKTWAQGRRAARARRFAALILSRFDVHL